MKRYLGILLSRILSYRNARVLLRLIGRISNCLHLHRFDVFDRIPDESCVIVFKHGFKVFGKVADFYLIGAGARQRVRGIFYPGLFQNEFCGAFLKEWRAIPANHLFHIGKSLRKGESIAIALDGLEQFSNQSGYLGAAWIAQKTGLPILPLRVVSRRNCTALVTGPRFFVPQDADRAQLRAITDRIVAELSR